MNGYILTASQVAVAETLHAKNMAEIAPRLIDGATPGTGTNSNASVGSVGDTITLAGKYIVSSGIASDALYIRFCPALLSWLNANCPICNSLDTSVIFDGGAYTPHADVQALMSAGWSGSISDQKILSDLATALLSITAISSAKTANKLLVWACIGNNVEDRKRCLYHPSGVGTKVSTAGNVDFGFLGATNTDGSSYIDTGWGLTGLNYQNAYIGIVADKMNCSQPLNSVLWNAGASALPDLSMLIKNNAQTLTQYCNWSSHSAATVAVSGHSYQYAYISSGFGASSRTRMSVNGAIVADPASPTRSGNNTGANNLRLLGPTYTTSAPNTVASPAGICRVRGVIACGFMSDADDASISTAFLAMSNARRNLVPPSLSGRTVRPFYIMGQSNAVGYQQRTLRVVHTTQTAVENYPISTDDVAQNLLMWDVPSSSILVAQNPLYHQEGYKGMSASMMGAVLEANAHPNDIILLVPAAKGATGFSTNDWNQGNTVYTEAKNRINAAKAAVVAAGGTIGEEFIIWCQGETDKVWGGDPNTAKGLYVTAFTNFLAAIASDCSMVNPLVSCLPVGYSQADNIMTAQQTVAASRKKMSVLLQANVTLTAGDDGVYWEDGEDPVHWSASGHRDIAVYFSAQLAAARANV